MKPALDRAVTLTGGVRMPLLGLGVYQSPPGRETRDAVRAAIEEGYRHVDTARVYGNERDVAAGIADAGVPRAELFVTTKLWNADHGHDAALRAFDASERRLGAAPDLYLVHWPVPGLRRETWRALVRLLEEGRVRAIGVSNYTVRHLEELARESPVLPAVNQVELHPFLGQRELRAHCRAKGIQVEGYAPLVKAERGRIDHPVVVRIAKAHRKTPAQVLVRWSIEHEVVTIPKSTRRERIAENAAVFDFALSQDERAALDALDEGYRTSWDPTDVA
jgi:diketogulonate reductase-like aldo/keto reductase